MKLFFVWLFLLSNIALGQNEFWGTKQYTFYTDLHLYSIYMDADMHILPTTRQQVLTENAYGLGDVFEVKNAEKNQCANMQRDYDKYKVLFTGRYVNGNHEMTRDIPNLIIDGHILLTHGDYAVDGTAKANQFRDSGVRCKGSSFIQKAIANNHTPISATDAQNLATYAQHYNGIDTIITGHRHVEVKFDQIVNGIRVISLPRGKNLLNL